MQRRVGGGRYRPGDIELRVEELHFAATGKRGSVVNRVNLCRICSAQGVELQHTTRRRAERACVVAAVAERQYERTCPHVDARSYGPPSAWHEIGESDPLKS